MFFSEVGVFQILETFSALKLEWKFIPAQCIEQSWKFLFYLFSERSHGVYFQKTSGGATQNRQQKWPPDQKGLKVSLCTVGGFRIKPWQGDLDLISIQSWSLSPQKIVGLTESAIQSMNKLNRDSARENWISIC